MGVLVPPGGYISPEELPPPFPGELEATLPPPPCYRALPALHSRVPTVLADPPPIKEECPHKLLLSRLFTNHYHPPHPHWVRSPDPRPGSDTVKDSRSSGALGGVRFPSRQRHGWKAVRTSPILTLSQRFHFSSLNTSLQEHSFALLQVTRMKHVHGPSASSTPPHIHPQCSAGASRSLLLRLQARVSRFAESSFYWSKQKVALLFSWTSSRPAWCRLPRPRSHPGEPVANF